jgi:glycosyltransferase involved in cell wall biosynthesis
MDKLRILLLNASAIYGGGEFYVLQLARALKNREHFVILGCRKDNMLFDKCKEEDISVEAVDFRENGSKKFVRNIKRIKQICETNSITIVHTNTGIDRTAGAIAAKLAKAKHVTSCHSLVSVQRNITHYIRNKKYTDAFIADGVTIKDLLINKDKINADKVHVINNGIIPKMYERDLSTRNEIRKSLGIADDEIVIGNTARLVYFKGHKYLLTAFANVKEKFKNVKLLIVGDGELLNELTDYAGILNISDNVIFAGFRDDIKEIYSAFDIYVQPSVSGGGELVPFTVLYAMAQKLPVIASGIGDLSYMVEDGKTGFIVKEQSPYNIAEKLEMMISDTDLRCKFGKAGYEKLLNEFTVDKMIEKTEELYYSIVKNQQANQKYEKN